MLVESQQQPAALPLLNYNNDHKHDSNASKWDEDDFADLLGCVMISLYSPLYILQLVL